MAASLRSSPNRACGSAPQTYSVDESAGTATLTVTLDAPFSAPVTVDYATGDQSAQAPDDYASSSGTLTFAPGTTTQTIEVPIADDTLDEEAETLQRHALQRPERRPQGNQPGCRHDRRRRRAGTRPALRRGQRLLRRK